MSWLPRLSGSRFKRSRSGRNHKLPEQSLEWAVLPEPVSVRSGKTSRYDTSFKAVKLCDASIILPVYNEQDCVAQTFDAVLEYADEHPTYEFIFVSDGSTDQTPQILAQRMATESDRIHLIAYPERGGKGYAVRQGVEAAIGDCVCFMDGDLAYSLDHLDLLLSKLEGYEVAIGCRSLVPDGNLGLNSLRKVAGKVFNTLSQRILNLHYVDMQAGLKGFQRSAAKEIFSRQTLTGFSFDVELIYLARKLGYSIGEIPARVSPQHCRKLSKVNLLLDSVKMLKDLFRIQLNDRLGRYE